MISEFSEFPPEGSRLDSLLVGNRGWPGVMWRLSWKAFPNNSVAGLLLDVGHWRDVQLGRSVTVHMPETLTEDGLRAWQPRSPGEQPPPQPQSQRTLQGSSWPTLRKFVASFLSLSVGQANCWKLPKFNGNFILPLDKKACHAYILE